MAVGLPQDGLINLDKFMNFCSWVRCDIFVMISCVDSVCTILQAAFLNVKGQALFSLYSDI